MLAPLWEDERCFLSPSLWPNTATAHARKQYTSHQLRHTQRTHTHTKRTRVHTHMHAHQHIHNRHHSAKTSKTHFFFPFSGARAPHSTHSTQSLHRQPPSGTLSSRGVRQNVWYIRSHWSQTRSTSSRSSLPHISQTCRVRRVCEKVNSERSIHGHAKSISAKSQREKCQVEGTAIWI